MTIVSSLRSFARFSALLAATVALPACADHADDSATARDVAVTRPAQALDMGAAARNALAANRYNWVGLSHNKGVDDFRTALRGGRPHSPYCAYVADFSAAADRLPADRKQYAAALKGTFTQRVLSTIPICAAGLDGPVRSVWMRRQEPSAAAQTFLTRVEEAVLVAEGIDHLAQTLAPILREAGGLPVLEFELVSAVASVAQNSFEYWLTNFDQAVQDFGSAYGGCANQYASYGYTLEQARQTCLGGDLVQPTGGSESTAPAVTATLLRGCSDGGTGMGRRGRSVARMDVRGAAIGGAAGIAGGPAGIAGGALGGGLAGSIGEMAVHAFDIWWCLVTQ